VIDAANVGDRPEQDQRIIFRRNKATPFPKIRSLDVDGIDNECTPANQAGRSYTTLQRMLKQSSTNSFSDVILICRKLSQQQARNGIRRLTGTDRSRQRCGKNRRRREAVIAKDPIGFMYDHDGRETLLLIGERARFQPSIQRRLATGKLGDVVSSRKWFRLGNSHLSLLGFCVPGFPRSGALKEFDHFRHRARGLRKNFNKGLEAGRTHPNGRRFHQNIFRRTYSCLAHEIGARMAAQGGRTIDNCYVSLGQSHR
jgi:hypothetical protein